MTLTELENAKTPSGTRTWHPMPHIELVRTAKLALLNAGLDVVGEQHALTKEDSRYFGLLHVQAREQAAKDYGWVFGLRSSHDQTFRASAIAGSSVFVCDNLSFSGEVHIGHRHTVNLTKAFPGLMAGAVSELMNLSGRMDELYAGFKACDLDDAGAHDLAVRCMNAGVIGCTHLPHVLEQWYRPPHKDFEPRNMWSLYNAVTGVLRTTSSLQLPERTRKLHGVFDPVLALSS